MTIIIMEKRKLLGKLNDIKTFEDFSKSYFDITVLKHLDKFLPIPKFHSFSKNCWDIDIVTLRSLHKFNIYMYDGNHSETSHYSALNHFLSCLDEVFIYLVDDWNWESVRSGTMQSIIDTKCEILYNNESDGYKSSSSMKAIISYEDILTA